MKHVLTIAGSDSCGGAGIQADLKTFSALGTYGMSVITAITAQNTQGVVDVREMDEQIIAEQIACLYEDIPIDAVKIGMVSNAKIAKTIAACLSKVKETNIVLDPVMISKSGAVLIQPEAQKALVDSLFPLARIITPNRYEAAALTGMPVETVAQMEKAATKMVEMGAKSVVIKGGHAHGDSIDVFYDGQTVSYYTGAWIDTENTHGTGCTFSSAIAALLAKGDELSRALQEAKAYLNMAIAHALPIGKGCGPTNHFYALYKKAGQA